MFKQNCLSYPVFAVTIALVFGPASAQAQLSSYAISATDIAGSTGGGKPFLLVTTIALVMATIGAKNVAEPRRLAGMAPSRPGF